MSVLSGIPILLLLCSMPSALPRISKASECRTFTTQGLRLAESCVDVRESYVEGMSGLGSE